FEHAAGPPRVAANDHAVAHTAENATGGASEREGELGREIHVGDPAHAVGPEKTRHAYLERTTTVIRAEPFAVAVTPPGTRIDASIWYVPGPFPVRSTIADSCSGRSVWSVPSAPDTVTSSAFGSKSAARPEPSPCACTAME